MLTEILRFLPMAEKIIPRKTSIGILENVLICDGVMRATNLEISIAMPIDSEIRCLIPMPIIKTIIKARPRQLDITQKSDLRVVITYDEKIIEFSSHTVDDFPVHSNEGFELIGTLEKPSIMNLYSLLPYCSTDPLRPALCGIDVVLNDEVTMVATNGHVLKKITSEGEFKDMQAILPANLVRLLPRIVKRQVVISQSDTYLKLNIDHDLEIITKLIEAKYPNVDRVIPGDFAHVVTFDKGAMLDLLRDAIAFADKEKRKADISFKDDHMVMQVENPDRNARWQGRLSFEGPMPRGYKLALNIDYMATMLKDIVEERIQWKHNEPDAAMVLQGIGVDDELCLIMPVRHRKESDEEPDH